MDTYNPDDAASWDIRRFFSDWVGAQFLSVMADGPHSARSYGGDYSLGFFILEDRIFERAVVEACAFWLFSTLSRHLDGALQADHTWGIATMRQRLVARLEAFVDVAEEFDQLPGLRGIASRVLQELGKRWPGTDPLPLYPAFRDARCDQGTAT